MGTAGAGNGAKRTSRRVQVDAGETLGSADLGGLLGVCVWNLPTELDDPIYQAWKRAGFTYPRWPFLSAEVSWRQESDGRRSMVLNLDPLDALLDGCRKTGIVPLFSFSDIPDALSSKPDAEAGDLDGPSHYAPADYEDWQAYVSRIVGRVVERGYAGGYYEVWNEPEDFKYCWKGRPDSTDTLADYIELYVHTARGIKMADPSARVGGPVCAHWDSVTVSEGKHDWGLPEFVRGLAEHRREHPEEGIPLDFLDWHDYSFATTVLSDGVDLVERALAEAGWPGRPEYLITEWNRTLEGQVSPQCRASHAAWNVIREAAPEGRRIARLYWYVLDGGWDTALVDGPPRARLAPSNGVSYTYGLSPSFAVFEMLGNMNRGAYVRVKAEDPLVALATADEAGLRLLVNNNTPDEHATLVELVNLPGHVGGGLCRIQRVDAEHSSDGGGLEEGEEAKRAMGQGSTSLTLSLPSHGTLLVTMAARRP